MAWLAVNKNGTEIICMGKPKRLTCGVWRYRVQECSEDGYVYVYHMIDLPTGAILKLIGRDMTWEDEPIEL